MLIIEMHNRDIGREQLHMRMGNLVMLYLVSIRIEPAKLITQRSSCVPQRLVGASWWIQLALQTQREKSRG